MTSNILILLLACCSAMMVTTTAFVASPFRIHRSQLHMAGFGSSSTDKKKKQVKLKPKAQWDRYTGDLKKEAGVRVAVAIDGEEKEWLEIGRVKSKGGAYTKAAVTRQRALIADHARRLFPLQVSQKDKIEWAYWEGDDDDGTWVVVDKNDAEDAPDGVEKLIGFEGQPDPATGFYCKYDAGRLVDSEQSKKLK